MLYFSDKQNINDVSAIISMAIVSLWKNKKKSKNEGKETKKKMKISTHVLVDY